ncbi:hypothetical protein GW17_00043884 [Ensete ventricosum]|uniref:Uncharacterized protein n=1 Tax=Ensete ventricosum TaxID=4639 RepID=A0A426Z444_ENSVE|nr:hypothetical protein B296_00026803 [Ensete ventricosum]RWV93650.1 hypothetical protein GW17_00043884 [Ensete ventricosum]
MATEPRSGPSLASSASRSVMSSSATTDAYPAVFKIGFGHNDAAYRSVQVLDHYAVRSVDHLGEAHL